MELDGQMRTNSLIKNTSHSPAPSAESTTRVLMLRITILDNIYMYTIDEGPDILMVSYICMYATCLYSGLPIAADRAANLFQH